ncbi:hypothetical protein, partial [Xenorhabdus koppenhoeferi]|uniref:hypothetical protein n=1 Tax=Xenorhabdus koppenhoeferi TaxID=351659 RepID=UPI002B408409
PAKGWPPVKGRSLSLIPWSIDNYVTGVSERSQQSCNLKDDRYKMTQLKKLIIVCILWFLSVPRVTASCSNKYLPK